jgi:hypothetical protein
MGPLTPGTLAAGSVSLATDHAVYAPQDPIVATVTNHLHVPATAIEIRANCPIFGV